ncbi:hypothetical protein SCHPADRAFT_947818 [Schizopora paradoxa]|uniref:Uncharacterized protein n=1 Tax=Schizopora paradoxa TaxID=27342 RepID=A0A0H2QZ84_9AGAM|nr:hypothetical protein SCHPADRAFT_947818 [Schizopora paradoxa]
MFGRLYVENDTPSEIALTVSIKSSRRADGVAKIGGALAAGDVWLRLSTFRKYAMRARAVSNWPVRANRYKDCLHETCDDGVRSPANVAVVQLRQHIISVDGTYQKLATRAVDVDAPSAGAIELDARRFPPPRDDDGIYRELAERGGQFKLLPDCESGYDCHNRCQCSGSEDGTYRELSISKSPSALHREITLSISFEGTRHTRYAAYLLLSTVYFESNRIAVDARDVDVTLRDLPTQAHRISLGENRCPPPSTKALTICIESPRTGQSIMLHGSHTLTIRIESSRHALSMPAKHARLAIEL